MAFYQRKKYGRGFQYFDSQQQKVVCKKALSTIKRMAIPPMWSRVRINLDVNSKIQATGRDSKGRKQYIYSEKWQLKQQKSKFKRMLAFGKQLPFIREYSINLLQTQQFQQDSILSLMVLILDDTGIRIGNKKYTEQNNTYGLSTLRKKHLQITANGAKFSYTGKSGKQRDVSIDEPWLAARINRCAEQPGYNIFRYKNDDGKWQDLDSTDVNEFIKKHMGSQFSCKDFRTWNATCLALEFYGQTRFEDAKKYTSKRKLNLVIKKVADELGNTPAICKAYYIHPKILGMIEHQSIPKSLEKANDSLQLSPSLNATEQLLLSLL